MTRNRLLIIVGVLLVILIGVSVYTFAILLPQAGQAAVSSVTPTPTGTVTTTKTGKARKLTGTIQSLGTSSMVILLHSGKTVTVNVDNTTKYSSSNGPATFSDLKVGQTVEVKGHTDPNDSTAVLALSITITPPSGTVSSISGQTLTLTTADNKTVTVRMSSTTVVLAATVPVSATFVTVGQTVGYAGTTASDGSVDATTLYLTVQQKRGSVTVVNSSTMTVQLANGSSQTFNLSPNTTYVQKSSAKAGATPTVVNGQTVKVGSKVVVAYQSQSGAGSGNATAVLVEV